MRIIKTLNSKENKVANTKNQFDLIFSLGEACSCSETLRNSNFNDIVFNHDFLNSVPFEKMYKTVKQKYDRRIKRLLYGIKHSKKVLVVYIETPTKDHIEVSNEEIKDLKLPITEEIHRTVLGLRISPVSTEDEVQKVVEVVNGF